MWSRRVWLLLRSEGSGGRRASTPRGRFSLALPRGVSGNHRVFSKTTAYISGQVTWQSAIRTTTKENGNAGTYRCCLASAPDSNVS
ncbi:hypothetical protein CB1_000916025 [Camelus ferus]|nr:hypothetical protein CB1_000916025 [Camelus ferus]